MYIYTFFFFFILQRLCGCSCPGSGIYARSKFQFVFVFNLCKPCQTEDILVSCTFLTPYLPLVEVIYVRGLRPLRFILQNYFRFFLHSLSNEIVRIELFHMKYNFKSFGCVVLPLRFAFRSWPRDQKVIDFRVDPLSHLQNQTPPS